MTRTPYVIQILFPFFLVVVILMIFAIAHHLRGHRASSCAIVFRHLELIMRQNLAIPVALQLAAQTERGGTRRVLMRCGQLTQLGLTLSDAMRRAYPKCPTPVLSALIVAERTNTLPAMLHEWAPRLERDFGRRPFNLTARFGYSLATWLLMLVVIFLESYFVWPKFRTIVSDFGGTLPPLTEDMLADPLSLDPPRTWAGWIVRLGLAATVAGAVILLFRVLLPRRRLGRVGPIRRLFDWLKWSTPTIREMTRADAWSQALPSIRLAVAAGTPLSDAALQATQLDVNSQLRSQLAEWSEAMKIGESPVAAARKARAPDMLVRWLSISVRDGSFDACLLHAERYYAALAVRRGNLFLQILWPIVMASLAALTGLLLYGMLDVLVMLLNQCMSYIE